MAFQDFFYTLEMWGVMDVVLPFILVFTIVFAVLEKIKILGEGKRQYNTVFALVMGATFVMPHITGSYIELIGFDPVVVLNQSLPQVSIIVVAIIMVLLIIGVFGNQIDFAGTPLSGWIVILAFIAVGLIFGSAVGWFYLPDWLYFLRDPEIQSLVVMILVFGIIIWFVTKEDSKDKKRTFGDIIQETFGSPMIKKK
ncbi:hypothetical protein JW711_03670 [Candidatus Woesearchaeota archaeon]|nr:hypothetical protein [Candidatus Woesearchaeota archaeon]